MKLAVSTYSLSKWRPDRKTTTLAKIDRIAEFGVKAVEFSGIDCKAGVARKRCEKHGLEVAGYCINAEFVVPEAARREAIDLVKTHVDFAAELGCRTMRHDVTRGFAAWQGYKGPQTFGAALKIVVPAIREIADYAATKGVTTTLENHGFFMQASARVEKLIKTVDHENFALTMDMGNFLCVNEDPTEAVKRVAKYAVMVHTKDFHKRLKKTMPPSGWFATQTPIALRGAIVGHGVLDIPAQLKLIKRAGYDGYLSLEFEGMEEPAGAIEKGLEYLRRELTALKVKVEG